MFVDFIIIIIDPAQMELDFARKETAPKKITEVLEKAQEPVEGKAAADFAEASRIAGKRKSEIALSDIEKKKYEEGLRKWAEASFGLVADPKSNESDKRPWHKIWPFSSESQVNPEDEKAKFIEIIALENVDINALGLYTLGELRKSSSQDNILKYQKSFEKYFLKSLTSRLTDYSSSKFEILGEDKKSATYTIINSKISPINGGPEIKIDWRIYTKNPEKPLIRDLIVEGLSMARVQKEEFASILSSNNNDIKKLIDKLDKFIQN